MSGGCRFSHAARFLQVPFFFRLEMIHCPLPRNVSGARQTEHWRLRGGFGGLAILASVGLGRVPGWQCWHSGRAGSSGDRIRVGIRHETQNWVSLIVRHHDRGRSEVAPTIPAPELAAIVHKVNAALRA
jgi:hypothetical protein